MSVSSLQITFSNRTSALECFTLEQEPWSVNLGKTSTMQAIQGISSAVYGNDWPEVACGGLNGMFNATVYVYPCNAAPAFQFYVSHGEVKSVKKEIVYREEIIQCSMQLDHETDYPVQTVSFMNWVGKCYDSSGNLTQQPAVVRDGRKITFDKKVFSSLRIRYAVLRYEYVISISKRVNAVENKYESLAYIVWNGGVKWLDINPPANFEAFDGDCGNGAFYGDGLQDGYNDGQLSQTHVCQPKYKKYPKATSANREITIDYCSQEKTKDIIKSKVDWESLPVECP